MEENKVSMMRYCHGGEYTLIEALMREAVVKTVDITSSGKASQNTQPMQLDLNDRWGFH